MCYYDERQHSCKRDKERFRMVCHTCGEIGPIGAYGRICLCVWPNAHIHCADHPCEKCTPKGER